MQNIINLVGVMLVGLSVAILPVYAQETIPTAATEENLQMPPQMPKRFEELKRVQKEAKDKAVEIREEVQEKREGMMEQREDRMQIRKEGMGERCDIVTGRIQNVTKSFDRNHQGQVKKYSIIVDRLQKIEAKFSDEGYDTTALAAGITTMEELLEQLTIDYENFIAKLEESKEFECGNATGDFKAAFLESREALAIVKQDVMALQKHYRTVIRPELTALHQQMEADQAQQEDATQEAAPVEAE